MLARYRPTVRRVPVISYALLAVGVLLLVVAVVYLTVAAPHLPGFFPGHVAKAYRANRYTKRGILALVLAIVAFAGALYSMLKHRAA